MKKISKTPHTAYAIVVFVTLFFLSEQRVSPNASGSLFELEDFLQRKLIYTYYK